MDRPKTRVLAKSNAQFQKAVKRLPLGVASTFRYWGDERTIYVHHGKGGRTWDIDGNCYVDYRLGYGPAILGYADDRVDAAARKGMEVGGVFALSTERELIVADRIAKMVPAAELVRFSNSGTEAVMAALRLARAYTSRDSYLLVEGGYHGLFDAAMWMANVDGWDKNSNDDPEVVAYSKGIPQTLKSLVHVVPNNSMQRLEDTFKQHGHTLAAMLIEPIQGNCCSIMASVEYVKYARELCDKYGVLLIIDEVKSGFRVGKGGIQGLYGVTPDITTFAKAVANGYPIAIVAGSEKVMRTFKYGGAAHGGTYTAHSVSLAAAEECLRILDETPALETLATYGEKLKARPLGNFEPPRHRPFLYGPPLHVRPVLRRKAARQLPRMEKIRLHLLRHDGLSPARPRHHLRARLARALVHVRSPWQGRELPHRYAEGG